MSGSDYLLALGITAGIITTISFLPQVIKSWRTRQTRDISLTTLWLLGTGISLWLIYGFFRKDLPIILANGITLCLVLTIIILKSKYK